MEGILCTGLYSQLVDCHTGVENTTAPIHTRTENMHIGHSHHVFLAFPHSTLAYNLLRAVGCDLVSHNIFSLY